MSEHTKDHDKMPTIWNQAMSNLEKVIPQEQFSGWITPLQPIAYTTHALVLLAPNQFHKEWLEDNYSAIISSAVSFVAEKPIRIEFLVLAD